jgi:hypothetical protein
MRLAFAVAFWLALVAPLADRVSAQAVEGEPQSFEAEAQALEGEQPSARDIVFAYNRGLKFSVAPGVMIPAHGGSVGFIIAADLRYGFQLGPLVLAPGVRPTLYFPPNQRVVTGVATLRLTFPVGPVGPFIVGGVGPGWIKHPSTFGVAYLGGGGLMVHIGTQFGIGAECSYQAITGTGFGAIFVGPLLLLSF